MTRLAAEVAESSQPQPQRRFAGIPGPVLLTLVLYLLGAIFVTARLWLHPAGLYQQGDTADVDQATWFIRATATELQHLHLPALITMAMNAPHGVNLMWNTSLLLPGVVLTPVTLWLGPQVTLTALLTIGFFGSAAAMFYVLRRFGASYLAAALGGALYGFSPALVNSGIGHYSLVLAFFPPLIIERVIRLVTGQGHPWRNGIWIGLMTAAQLFISEEALVDGVIATVIVLVLLAICRPRLVISRIRPLVIGLAVGGAITVVLFARAAWVQFHGVAAQSAAATVTIMYNGHLTNLGTLPYAFVNPSEGVLLHTTATARIANNYPQPLPEYLAYLGVLLILVLILTVVLCWKNLTVRIAGLTCLALEWLAMGSTPILPRVSTLPSFLLPWRLLEHLPVINGMVPDRLCILADAAAAVVLAIGLDLARKRAVAPFDSWRRGGAIAIGVVVIALLPVIPAPYGPAPVETVPAGYTATFRALDLPASSRVLLAPFPYSGTSQIMRWQSTTRYPATMIGGDFIEPGKPGRSGRAGRAGMTPTSYYINYLGGAGPYRGTPSPAQVTNDLRAMQPQAVVAVTTPASPLGRFLIRIFGQPRTRIGSVLGWRLPAGWSPHVTG